MSMKLGRAASPAAMRDFTQVTRTVKSGILVNVRNSKSWNREAFFEWLLSEMVAMDPPIPHLGRLAEMAGMHPSTLSNWKSGKNPPTTAKLAAIADVLGKPAHELWERAGLTSPDHALEGRAATTTTTTHAKVSTESWGVAMILASDLSEGSKRMLLELHEEDMRRARAEAERQLRDKIHLIAATEQ